MFRKLLSALKRRAMDALAVVGAVGFWTVIAFAEDVRRSILENPTASALLSAAAFFLGATVARFVSETSTWARRWRLERELAETFSCLPDRMKRKVAVALDERELVSSALDGDAKELCDLGIFKMPAEGARMVDGMSFLIEPSVAKALRRNRAEWLGM